MQPSADNTSPRRYIDDEIDLFELFETLWKQKLLITLITLVVTAVGTAYALLAPKQYQASVSLLAPPAGTLKPLTSLPLYDEVASQSLIRDLAIQMNLPSFRLAFINQIQAHAESLYPGDTDTEHLKALSDRLAISPQEEKNDSPSLFPYTLTFLAPAPDDAVAELNRFVIAASDALISEIRQRYNLAVFNEQRQIQRRIDLLEKKMREERMNEIVRLQEAQELKLKELTDALAERKQYYKARLQDKISALEEAYAIANTLNITEPVGLNQLGRSTARQVEIIADISNRAEPLYLRGTRLLGAELDKLRARPDDFYADEKIRELEAQIAYMDRNRKVETLLARESDHPFSEEIRSLKTRAVTLEAEQFPDDFAINFMPSPAVADPAPVSPKKLLIVALSAILGGMAGIIIALIRSAVIHRRQAS